MADDPFKTLPLQADTVGVGSCVVDMVYRPGGTRLLAEAKRQGADVVDGLEILVAQGAASFEGWTDRTAPREVMRQAVADARHMNPPTTAPAPRPRSTQRRHDAVAPRRLRPRARGRLVDLGFVSRATMDGALGKAHASGSAAERVLVADGTLSQDQLARAVAERFGLDHLDLDVYRVDPDAAKLVSPAAIKRYQAVPVSFVGDRTLLVAMADPANVLAVDDIAVMTGYEVRPAVASRGRHPARARPDAGPELGQRQRRRAGRARGGARARARRRPLRPTTSASRARELRRLGRGRLGHPARQRVIHEAVERGASDIHFEPGEDEMRVRYRIDGVLQEAAIVPLSVVPAVISRVKILADLDIAERRIPQDGRISHAGGRARRSTCASPRCRRSSARRSSCASWTPARR